MFSLIALYIQYRKAQSADVAPLGATASKSGPANDAADIGIARAA
jgi:hypothetical protein